MPNTINPILPLDTVAHIIQVALTPVFLLSGIATLLNVFSTRLARVADRVDQITTGVEGTDAGDVTLLASCAAVTFAPVVGQRMELEADGIGGASPTATGGSSRRTGPPSAYC